MIQSRAAHAQALDTRVPVFRADRTTLRPQGSRLPLKELRTRVSQVRLRDCHPKMPSTRRELVQRGFDLISGAPTPPQLDRISRKKGFRAKGRQTLVARASSATTTRPSIRENPSIFGNSLGTPSRPAAEWVKPRLKKVGASSIPCARSADDAVVCARCRRGS